MAHSLARWGALVELAGRAHSGAAASGHPRVGQTLAIYSRADGVRHSRWGMQQKRRNGLDHPILCTATGRASACYRVTSQGAFMWGYYVALALRSSARSKALTALVIVLLAFGVAACMVSYAVFRATTSDPLPDKSSRLFVPQIDNVGPVYNWDGDPLESLSYMDAVALWQAHQAKRQTILFASTWQLNPADHPTPGHDAGRRCGHRRFLRDVRCAVPLRQRLDGG